MAGADQELSTDTRGASHARGGGELDAWSIGAIIWARRSLVLWTALIVIAISAAALYSITPLYSSQAKIIIENRESQFTRPAREDEDQFLSDQAAVLSQVEVLSSRDLAMKVVDKMGLAGNANFTTGPGGGSVIGGLLVTLGLRQPASDSATIERVVEVFSERLKVFQIGTSRVIAVEFAATEPELAANVANTLAGEYIAFQRVNKLDTNQEAIAWLGREIEGLRERVSEAEENVARFRSESGIFTTDRETTLNEQQLSELSAELIRASAAQSEARAKANLINQLLEEPGSIEEAADVLSSTLIQRLREQQAAVSREHAELSATMLPGHPRMRELSAELADLDQRIQTEARKIARGLENEAALAGARVDAIRTSLTEVQTDAGANSQAEVQLRALQREAAAQRDILESFLRRYREAASRQDVEVQSADARIISRASVPSSPSYPPRGPILALASVAGVLLGLMAALLADMASGGRQAAAPRREPRVGGISVRKSRAESDVAEQVAGEQVAGEPDTADRGQAPADQPRPAGRGAMVVHGPRPAAQQIAELVSARGIKRFAILRLDDRGDSFDTAVRLAGTVAASGMKPVVVEAAPEAKGGADGAPGLFDVLSGEAALGEALTTAPDGAVTLIRAGREGDNRDDLVGSGRVTLVVDALLRRFDVAFVVAGVLGAGDNPATIALACDHVLIAMPEKDVSQRRIKTAGTQLARAGMNRAAIVGESPDGLTVHDPAGTQTGAQGRVPDAA